MVILQRVQLVTVANNICTQVDAWLDSWNSGAFNKLVCEFCIAATGYMGRARGNQNSEQCHCTFLKLVIRGKFREAFRFIYERDLFFSTTQKNGVQWNGRYGGNHHSGFGWEKSARKTPPLFYIGGVRRNTSFYSCVYYVECGQIGCMKTFGEFRPRWYGLGRSTFVAFKIRWVQKNKSY